MKVRVRRNLSFYDNGALTSIQEGTECDVLDRTDAAIRSREEYHERALLRHHLARTQGEAGQVWFLWAGSVRYGEIGNEVEYVLEPGAGLPLNQREAGVARARGVPSWAKQATP